MPCRSTVTWLLGGFFLTQNLAAQTGDWNVVMATPPGSHLLVTAGRQHRSCTLLHVTDQELICDRDPAPPFGSSDLVFTRQEIRQVRREYARRISMATGAAIGAAAGAGIGATIRSKDPEERVYGAIGSVLIGVVVGLLVGRIVSHFHGRVIYQR
jgi:hypothetical protein